jgi:hypothetical protein
MNLFRELTLAKIENKCKGYRKNSSEHMYGGKPSI